MGAPEDSHHRRADEGSESPRPPSLPLSNPSPSGYLPGARLNLVVFVGQAQGGAADLQVEGSRASLRLLPLLLTAERGEVEVGVESQSGDDPLF